MTMPPEKVAVLVITAVIAILVSVTLLNSPERSDRDRDAAWGHDAFDDLEVGVDDLEVEQLRAGEGRTRIIEPRYKKRLDPKKKPEPKVGPALRHRVRNHETLGSIARKHYGKSSLWPVIAKANPGIDPNKMRAGIDLVIPSLEGRRVPGNRPPRSDPRRRAAGGRWYTVAHGDNLERIAKKHLGKSSAWRRIYDANRSRIRNPAVIREGQRLLIPVAR